MRAARREAMEEAGASGRIEAKPFTRYRLSAWTGTGLLASEVCVEAYLMEVEALAAQGSAERRAGWFTPELAASKLAENRGAAYAREHRRVVREAVAELQSRRHPNGEASGERE